MKEQGNLLATKIHFSSSAITDDMLLLVDCKKTLEKDQIDHDNRFKSFMLTSELNLAKRKVHEQHFPSKVWIHVGHNLARVT